ncbi:MAG TPA: DUF2299 family protein [Nitrososphaeraceae archaeon]|nr:DUF2299 family protein [Nitrososphaeraceae archaeon]
MDKELNVKEVAFTKVTQWLSDQGFRVKVTTRNKNVESETQFEAEVYPRKGGPEFFYITFGSKTNDSFSINSTINFSEEDKRSIEAVKERVQDQVYIDIRKLVYPLGINCDTTFPQISFHKLVFIDSLRDKQYFFDSVAKLFNAMLLVSLRFRELMP